MTNLAAQYFSENYSQARERFRAACFAAKLDVSAIVHPQRGPEGEELAIDWTLIGNPEAANLLVLTSGVHGPELMTGSGCQTGHIANNHFASATASGDVAVLLIHGANPWGTAYLRRNNEDNVDLCRNFVDFSNPPAHNHDYDNIKDILPLVFIPGSEGDAAREQVEAYKASHGNDAFGRGFMAGQYHDPKGVSFGGMKAVWSNEVLSQLLRDRLDYTRRVCLMDYHSGLGPYAYCTTVCLQTGDNLQLARNVFGPWILAPNDPDTVGDGKAPDVSGHTTDMHERIFVALNPISVVLEYGVEAYDHTAEILMREHRLYHDDQALDEDRKSARQDLLRAFYPADPHWRQSVYDHSCIAINQALAYLKSGVGSYGER